MLEETGQNLTTDAPQVPSRPANQFSLRSLLWGIALFGLFLAPVANFGVEALPLSGLAIILIALVWNLNTSALSKGIIAGLLWIAGVVVIDFTVRSREPPPSSLCQGKMRSVRVALENYAQQHHGRLPPAAMPGIDGRAWHSWRVLVLPYIGAQGLYDSYSLFEPWDGPRNRGLAPARPWHVACYQERNQPRHSTIRTLVTGAGSAWGDGKPPTTARLEKLPPDTIVMMEVKNCGIQWMEPRDLTIDEIMGLVDAHGLKHISPHDSGLIVLNAGRYVESLPLTTDRETLRRRLTAADD